MSTFGQLGQPKSNKTGDLRQGGNGSPLAPFTNIAYLITTTICGYLFAEFPHGLALVWSITICTFVGGALEIGPWFHRRVAIHFLVGMIAAYLALVTGSMIRHHSFHICFA